MNIQMNLEVPKVVVTATVKTYSPEKGFGFVDLDGNELFFHISALRSLVPNEWDLQLSLPSAEYRQHVHANMVAGMEIEIHKIGKGRSKKEQDKEAVLLWVVPKLEKKEPPVFIVFHRHVEKDTKTEQNDEKRCWITMTTEKTEMFPLLVTRSMSEVWSLVRLNPPKYIPFEITREGLVRLNAPSIVST